MARMRISFSFTIAVGLLVICLVYIPQWKNYAPSFHPLEQVSPYLTPWTVVSVMVLSLALGLLSAPFRKQHANLVIFSKTISVLVGCFSIVFLLEYATGIRFRDLDIFFLPDSSAQPVVLHAARPTPNGATTSLCFAIAFLLFRNEPVWRKRVFQLVVLVALLLPTVEGIGYLSEFLFPPHASARQNFILSLPAVILYYLLGSGALGLGSGLRIRKPADTRLDRRFVRPA
jgi:hypothetical protein